MVVWGTEKCFCFVDIVFLIFLYQRWIYKVDPTRVNEFGTSGETPESEEQSGDGSEAKAKDENPEAEVKPLPNKSETEKKTDWSAVL